MSINSPVPEHHHKHLHGLSSIDHNYTKGSNKGAHPPNEPHHLTKSSDFINLTEPPEASKTPDPASLFPLRRRASSNYQTALLSNKLRSSLSSFHHDEERPSEAKTTEIEKQPKIEHTPSWSTELSKHSLQRASIDLSHVPDHDQGIFSVEYNQTSHNHGHVIDQEIDPLNKDIKNLERSKSGESLSYHSNQANAPIPYSAPINIPTSTSSHDADGVDDEDQDYSTRSSPGFEYDKFKRSMQYDY